MRTRSVGLSVLVTLALIVAGCAAGASPTPSGSALKIGVVTDVGTVNDKNFNEYSYKGAVAGATDIGAAAPKVSVPKSSSEYASLMQAFVDQKFDIIVTVGFNLGPDTTKAAKANPNTWFVGVDQSPICVDATGAPAAKCAGDAKTLLPKYVSLTFQEDQAGYLVGIVAGTLTKSGVIGAIGGITLCGPCVRYIQGYELGAKSVRPDVKVISAYVTTSDFTKAFGDPVGGKAFADSFIKTNHPDVLFQVAGQTGNGVLDSACAAGITGIGVDVDQYLSYPNADKCIVTSAEKHLLTAVETTIKAIAGGTAKAGDDLWNAARNGVGYSDFHDKASLMTADLKSKLDAAFAAMQAGTLTTCPTNCGTLQ